MKQSIMVVTGILLALLTLLAFMYACSILWDDCQSRRVDRGIRLNGHGLKYDDFGVIKPMERP